MSQNCKSTFATSSIRDANNNTLYHAAAAPGFNRPYPPQPYPTNANYQQMTAKVIIGMSGINDLKVKENPEEVRRSH